jgi:hypothetical protein
MLPFGVLARSSKRRSNMQLRPWLYGLGSAVVGAIVVLPAQADAFSRRVDATACFPQYGYQITTTGLGIKNSGTTAAYAQCPVPDDDNLLPQNMSYVNVHGYINGSGTVSATACVHYWDTPSGTCDTSASATGAYLEYTLPLPHSSAWSAGNANHFHYIYLNIPVGAYVSGYFLAG